VSPKKVVGTFKHPQGGSSDKSNGLSRWLNRLAFTGKVVAGLKYPEDMLRARVISRAVRSIYPACILGHYAVEEVQDFDSPAPKHMGMVEEVKSPVESIEAPTGDYPLILPDGSVYASFDSPDAWITAYTQMASKVMQSTKLNDEQRT
jgi:hypothetical protein